MSLTLPEEAKETRETRLKPPRGISRMIARTCREIADMLPADERSPIAAWLAENGDFLLDGYDALKRETSASPRLPSVDGETRVLVAARSFVDENDGGAEKDEIAAFLRERRKTSPFRQDELEWFPYALKTALFEMLAGALATAREEARVFRAARRAIQALRRDGLKRLPRDAAVVRRMAATLNESEDAEAVKRFDALTGGGVAVESESGVNDYRTLARVIHSLHAVMRLPWREIIENASIVSSALAEDATYPRMDAESRAYYVRTAVYLARRYRVAEERVAEAAVLLTRDQQAPANEAGYFLIERPDLIAAYLFNRKPRRSPDKRRERAYCLSLYALSLLGASAICLYAAPVWMFLPIALCLSEIVRRMIHAVIARRVPARMLPRLAVDALSRETRTLVVIPALIIDQRHALSLIKNIAVLMEANNDKYLDFMLLGDFVDAGEKTLASDREIVDAADRAVYMLNRDSGRGVFYLQRARAFHQAQKRWMGRERKRGALETLTKLLLGESANDALLYASVDVRSLAGRYRYVITLDADTFMPPEAPLLLVGAMAHPLQKGRIAVIQPRMEILADTVKTRAQKYLGGMGGSDPYCAGVKDAYQDLFGRGSFMGKGILDLKLWRERLDGKMPEGLLLSHDLIEGEYARSALADDIAFYDGQPARVQGWYKRLHRWTRGDWQLLSFLFRRELPLISRHKIYDNLRRSLVPLARMIVLISSAAYAAPLVALVALPYPLRGVAVRLALLPAKAYACADAALRAVYRQWISHRHLLSWVTAAQAEKAAGLPLAAVFTSILSGVAVIALSLAPGGFLPFVALGLWFTASPILMNALDGKISPEQTLPESQRGDIQKLCADTWRYFEETVNEAGHFLPPDNVQIDPDTGFAMRTSPTNIGLYLLSCAAACELKLIDGNEMARRLSETLSTMQTLDRWKGHLYNWYDTATLRTLAPRFVSSVDSGNLVACLYACAQCVRARLADLDARYVALPTALDAFADETDLAALFDAETELFYIGCHVDDGSFGEGHYDLLASESRLLSFVALMNKRVPLSHWRHLGRDVTRAGGGAALISWAGTMFEYLMPLLLTPLVRGTLLGESCLNAVREQMSDAFAPVWGVSESGYYGFDAELHYQYRAFGLRSLSLTSGTQGNVVAPYASMLALPVLPRSAANNLIALRKMDMSDDHGLFEAIDFTRQRIDHAPRIVRSHMSHHQGMILCAACNALTDGALVRRFCAVPAVRAHLYLLYERAPVRVRKRREHLPPPVRRTNDGLPPYRAHRALPPDTWILSGKTVSWQINALGQSRLAIGNVCVTRFSADASAETGMQIYLVDRKTNGICRPARDGTCVFRPGTVEFTHERGGLLVREQRLIDPIEDAAVARVRIKNTTAERKEIDIVSFLELSLSTERADDAHANFRDMTVRVDKLSGSALIARRRPRDERDRVPCVAHAVITDSGDISMQGDRAAFLGRAGDYGRPEQLSGGEARSALGDTLAPCMSLRASLSLCAGGEREIWMIVFPCRDENDAGETLARYAGDRVNAVPALAETRARVLLKSLHFDAPSFSLAVRILSRIAYADASRPEARPPAPVDVLWRHGITGDDPVWMVVLRGADPALIRQVLRVHALLSLSGRTNDLIFAIAAEESYFAPVRDAVTTLASSGVMRDKIGKSGGVHILSVGSDEREELASLSRLVLRDGEPLKKQLAALPSAEEERAEPRAPEMPPLPPLEGDNGCGGFTAENGYCVYRTPPCVWCNILSGERFGTVAGDRGILQSHIDNSYLRRLTRHDKDIFRPLASELYTLTDVDGAAYSLEGGYVVHRPGVSTYYTDCGGVRCELSVLSPPGAPCGARLIKMQSATARDVTLTAFVRFAVGERPETTSLRTDGSLLTARGCGAALTAFLYHQDAAPEISPFATYPASVRVACALRAHEARTEIFLIGAGENAADIREICDNLLSVGASAIRRRTLSFWQEKLSRLTVYGGDRDAARMLNQWLLYQTIASRLYARTGLYQTGGAWGFRDQLQDVLALLDTEPAFARAHILRCAAHQYVEGDVQHWWHEPRTGVRTRVTDDLLFLPFVTARYVRATGDRAILDESVPYLSSPTLSPGEDDRYETPQIAGSGTLHEHCLRAVDHVRLGAHGMPLMGGGDWNDGMNRVGGATGESVWLGFFLAMVLAEYAELCDREMAQIMISRRRELLTASDAAWTGAWYLRAWYDGGDTLGGDQSDPPRIDLISQCFAVLAGADRSRARAAVAAAVDRLYDREHGMVRLLSPPFDEHERAGYITAYPPGVRENGGQYTHAVPWLIEALCKLRLIDLAYEIALAILPPKHADTPEKAEIYRVEPYVMAADVYAGAQAGRGGWTWYTGSAAWTYLCWFKTLYGFEKVGDRARLSPKLPEGHEEFTVRYRYGASCYDLTASEDTLFVTCDGEKCDDGWIDLKDDGKRHEARFPIRG